MSSSGLPSRRAHSSRAAEHETPEEREALQRVLQTVSVHTGMRFDETRRDHAAATIRGMAGEKGLTLIAFARQIGRSRQALEELTAELSIGETYFFREPAHFEILQRRIIASWSRERAQPLTIWSAACASGEEPYSAAIVAHESGIASRVRIIGTDISHRALNKARQAIYRPWSLRGPAAHRARPYLSELPDGRLKLTETIRRLVAFDYLNLANDPYPSLPRGLMNVDVIFCRNVLIYFDEDVIAAVARKLFDTLAPDGWLFVGASDPSLSRFAPFELLMTDGGVVYRKPGARRSAFAVGLPAATAIGTLDESNGTWPDRAGSSGCVHDGEAASMSDCGAARADERSLGDAPPSSDLGTVRLPAEGRAGQPSQKAACGEAAQRTIRSDATDGGQPAAPPRVQISLPPAQSAEQRREFLLSLRRALKDAEYEHVLRATEGCENDGEIAALRVRALAGLDPVAARSFCERLLAADPLDVPLRYLLALLLLDLGEMTLALQALQRVLFLDRNHVEALFTLATVYFRLGKGAEAAKVLRTAERLCAERDSEELLPGGDGATVGELLSAIRRHPTYSGGERR